MVKEIVNKIKEANYLYRVGKPIMSDSEYDILIEELKSIDPDNDILNDIGFVIKDDNRKRKLSIPMFSMNKIKSISDVDSWASLKGISKSEYVIITPKFDGLSLCVNELNNEATTRGDGLHGQICDEHYKLIDNHLYDVENFDTLSPIDCQFTYGEVIMSKKRFTEKYSNDFANPRNLVAGLLNSKEANQSLKDCDYIKYGAIFTPNLGMRITKQQVLDYLNQYQKVKVQYHICQVSELTEELLINLFNQYSVDYEIDGLIIEINDLNKQNELGRETSSNNPVWARAFKHPSFEQSAQTEIIGISWNISKQGYLKPTLHINPVRLDGVTVSNVTGNNARFVKDMGIGVGAKVLIKRSGFVIPIITDVIKPVEFIQPTIEGVEIDWNEAGIELITLTETNDQKLKKIIAFFEILEADSIGEGIVKQLWDAGYKTIEQILNLNTTDLEGIDRFGKRKAKIIFDSIQKSIKGVQLSKLQHATGIFTGLGSKKLVLLENFIEKPTIQEVMKIDGFAEISAKTYVDNYDNFFDFIKNLPVEIDKKVEVDKISNDLDGMVFVFTGIRMKSEEVVIESRGAKIASSVSKNTTHLVCKDPYSGSSKLEKAKSIGVKVIGVDEFLKIIS
jgi:DNA ligase (NAD+)